MQATTGAAWALAVALGAAPLAAAARQDNFEARCEQLADQAQILVDFDDSPVERDDSRSLEALKKLAASAASPHHNVLGLTHAKTSVVISLAARFLTRADGQVCAVPSVKIRLGFSEFQVYLARELGDACRRRIVNEHEEQHVAIWRTHLHAGAQALAPLLQRELARPFYFDSRREANAALLAQVKAQIAPRLQQLTADIAAAQKTIDSPASYARVDKRLRACSGAGLSAR
ncbi:MAG: hypothetical protein PHY45_02100 [Rhodocyclaceae bacterium]|nr:hypothetical protein [Rhodocyclaceae bacterium]